MKTRRSRSLRRVMVKVPGGTTKLVYKKRKPGKPVCSACGDVLKGTLREVPSRMRHIAKTKKRPQRPYGGLLCSRCMRKLIVSKARSSK